MVRHKPSLSVRKRHARKVAKHKREIPKAERSQLNLFQWPGFSMNIPDFMCFPRIFLENRAANKDTWKEQGFFHLSRKPAKQTS
jgi:hypothetical protein